MAHVFISYRNVPPDQALAKTLYDQILKGGHTAFLDKKEIPAGAEWEKVIAKHLNEATHFVVLLSEKTETSDYVKEEVARVCSRSPRPKILSVYLARELRLGLQLSAKLKKFQRVPCNPWDSHSRISELVLAAVNGETLPVEAEPIKLSADYLKQLREETCAIDLLPFGVSYNEVPREAAIDELYIPLKTIGRQDGKRQKEGLPQERKSIALEAALQSKKVVFEGGPGSGKTTFLRRIAWALCRPDKKKEKLKLGDWQPVFIRISELESYIRTGCPKTDDSAPNLTDDPRWIPHYLAHRRKMTLNEWDAVLRQDSTLLMLDGLDEGGDERRREEMVSLFRKATQDYPCRFVVTTRPGVHEKKAVLQGFEQHQISDLDVDEVEIFLKQWCGWLKNSPAAAASHYKELTAALRACQAIRDIKGNPLMLTALAVVYLLEKKVPEQIGRAHV